MNIRYKMNPHQAKFYLLDGIQGMGEWRANRSFSSFRDVIAVGDAGEFDVFRHGRTVIFRGLLNLLGIVTADLIGIVFVAKRPSAVVAVFLQLVNFGGEASKVGRAPMILVRVGGEQLSG